MKVKVTRNKLLCLCVVLMALTDAVMSAVVAQHKVFEMVKQVMSELKTNSSLLGSDHLQLGRMGEEDFMTVQGLPEPLSLQYAVLQVTDSLTKEMNSPTWQAMLRALGGDREILKRFAQLRPRFALLEQQVGDEEDKHEELIGQLSNVADLAPEWKLIWDQLQPHIQTIENLHDWFDRYQRNAAVVNERTLRDFAETVHDPQGRTIIQIMEHIHSLVHTEEEFLAENFTTTNSSLNRGAFQILQSTLSQGGNNVTCSLTKSPQQLVHELYTYLAVTDAKAYAIVQFSWMLLRLYGKGNYTKDSDQARVRFTTQIQEKATDASEALSQLSSWMWKCDDPRELNQSYIQFTELLQGYIVNEVDLNPESTCKESCSAYTNSKELGCFNKDLCASTRTCANGRIYNCRFVEADSTVCLTNATDRRYDWVEYKSGRTFGKKKSECNQPGEEKHTVNSWWRWVFWHCSFCSCLCDQPGVHSDRYFSLQSAVSSVARNYLVTGVRFVKSNRIIHIQIQEGEALPRGLVNKSSLSWRPIEPVTIPRYREMALEDGPGYATLRYEERALDLDDLQAPEGHVVTGLRFRKLGGHLNLEIQVSPINFASGQIDSERATWVSNDNTPVAETNPRTKINLLNADSPLESPTGSQFTSSLGDQYIEFQATSLEKDLAQTTVPFLDAVPVYPEPPTWLSGIGIFHKGQTGYGGYISFRVSSFNVNNYIAIASANLPHTTD